MQARSKRDAGIMHMPKIIARDARSCLETLDTLDIAGALVRNYQAVRRYASGEL